MRLNDVVFNKGVFLELVFEVPWFNWKLRKSACDPNVRLRVTFLRSIKCWKIYLIFIFTSNRAYIYLNINVGTRLQHHDRALSEVAFEAGSHQSQHNFISNVALNQFVPGSYSSLHSADIAYYFPK